MIYIFSFILSVLVAVILVGITALVVNCFYASSGYSGAVSDHFDGKHFYNIGWSPRESYRIERSDGKKGGLIYWLLHREKAKWQEREITQVKPRSRVTEGIEITNVGHATYLIQTNGLNILTDPVWSKRTSPWQWVGPRRYSDVGVAWSDLPEIDIVLLSHNHYDHMDISTLEKLRDEKGDPTIYTGLGNKKYLEKRNIKNVVEMDWWDQMDNAQLGMLNDQSRLKTSQKFTIHHSPFTITFLPAQHFSARGITDRNKTLWGGFRLEVGGKSLYFAGDTGYGEFTKKIAERYREGFDYGLIPIGAYKPRWFMAPVHTDPFEGMAIQKDLDIKKGIGIHHSTFDLADDNQDDPIIDLEAAKKQKEYSGQFFEAGPNGSVWKW